MKVDLQFYPLFLFIHFTGIIGYAQSDVSLRTICDVMCMDQCIQDQSSNCSCGREMLLQSTYTDCITNATVANFPCYVRGRCIGSASIDRKRFSTEQENRFEDYIQWTFLPGGFLLLKRRPRKDGDLPAMTIETELQDSDSWRSWGQITDSAVTLIIPLDICKNVTARAVLMRHQPASGENLVAITPAMLIERSHSSVQLSSLEFDDNRKEVVATYEWLYPEGYGPDDIDFQGQIETYRCPVGTHPPYDPVKYSEPNGIILEVRFPEEYISKECGFLLMFAATSCGQTIPHNVPLFLHCNEISNYRCPSEDIQPQCISSFDVISLANDELTNSYSARISWQEPTYGKPLYYILRWGRSTKAEFLGFAAQSAQRHKRQSFGDIFPASLKLQMDSGFFTGNDGALSPLEPRLADIWQIERRNESYQEINGSDTSFTLSGLKMGSYYGLQLCGIYNNGSEDDLEFGIMSVYAFLCTCPDSDCSSMSCANSGGLSYSTTATTTTTTETTSEVLTLSHPRYCQIDPLQNMFAFLHRNSNSNVTAAIYVGWTPVTTALEPTYNLLLIARNRCVGPRQLCCMFAEMMTPIATKQGSVNISTPLRIAELNCLFEAQVWFISGNGISSPLKSRVINEVLLELRRKTTINPITSKQNISINDTDDTMSLGSITESPINSQPSVGRSEKPANEASIELTGSGKQNNDATTRIAVAIAVPLAVLVILTSILTLCFFYRREICSKYKEKRAKRSLRISSRNKSSVDAMPGLGLGVPDPISTFQASEKLGLDNDHSSKGSCVQESDGRAPKSPDVPDFTSEIPARSGDDGEGRGSPQRAIPNYYSTEPSRHIPPSDNALLPTTVRSQILNSACQAE